MTAKPQQRRMGAIEPEIVTRSGLAIVEPAGLADFDGWDVPELVKWIRGQAGRLDDIRVAVGLGLWVLRERQSESEYMTEVERLCEVFDVSASTLWRWREKAQTRFVLEVPEAARGRSEAGRASVDAKAVVRENANNAPPPEDAADPPGSLVRHQKRAVSDQRPDDGPAPTKPGSGPIGGAPVPPPRRPSASDRPLRAKVQAIAVESPDALADACELVELREARDRLDAAYRTKTRRVAPKPLERTEVVTHWKGNQR